MDRTRFIRRIVIITIYRRVLSLRNKREESAKRVSPVR